MHPLLNIAIQAARQASKVIVRALDQLDSVKTSSKGFNDYVTEIDQQSEQEIVQVIRKSYPEHSILAEESGLTARNNTECTWIIDPLDGTVNFMRGIPHFCISIAAKVKNQYEVGVVYDPVRQELFTAAKGQGAQLDHRRIRVSSTKKMAGSIIATGFPVKQPQHIPFHLRTIENILFQEIADVRRAGAAALDLAYVAAGRMDAFWEIGLKEWDMAAGVLLVQEAGGLACDFEGGSAYAETGNLVAGTPRVCQLLQEAVVASRI